MRATRIAFTTMTGLAGLGLWASLAVVISSQAHREEAEPMSGRAIGTFEVKVTPVTVDQRQTVASGRLSLDKTYQGDLVGTSSGEMWTVDTSVKGSGGYVAIERVAGTLRGRRGAFVLLHQGTMSHGGDYKLTLVVVPDSGTDQLAGLSGSMAIIIANGKHSYEFEYSISESPTTSTPRR